jgi:hypothetical protein
MVASDVSPGELSGARLCLARPEILRLQTAHAIVYPVLRLVLCRAHNSLMVHEPLARSCAKWFRSNMGLVSNQSVAVTPKGDSESVNRVPGKCEPCPRTVPGSLVQQACRCSSWRLSSSASQQSMRRLRRSWRPTSPRWSATRRRSVRLGRDGESFPERMVFSRRLTDAHASGRATRTFAGKRQ